MKWVSKWSSTKLLVQNRNRKARWQNKYRSMWLFPGVEHKPLFQGVFVHFLKFKIRTKLEGFWVVNGWAERHRVAAMDLVTTKPHAANGLISIYWIPLSRADLEATTQLLPARETRRIQKEIPYLSLICLAALWKKQKRKREKKAKIFHKKKKERTGYCC